MHSPKNPCYVSSFFSVRISILSQKVNAPALAEMGNPTFAPWVELAQKLGAFAIASSDVPATEEKETYNLSVCGDEINKAGKLLATAAALGMAGAKGLPPCNMISAQSILKLCGTEVSLKKEICFIIYCLNFVQISQRFELGKELRELFVVFFIKNYLEKH